MEVRVEKRGSVAGHEAPVVGGPSRSSVERLEPTGPALGMMPDMTFRARQTVLAPGETLFAFTDGVTDSKDPSGRFFTEERLLQLVSKGESLAKALLEAVETAVAAHAAGSEPSDDITMLAVRRTTESVAGTGPSKALHPPQSREG